MRGMPDTIKNNLQTIMCHFLLNNKKPLVSKKTTCQNLRDGGLDMIDINTVIQCMQIKTIYKILNSKLVHWNAIGKSYLKIADSNFNQQYFVCNCSSVDGLKCLNQSKIPIFYKNAILSWTAFKRLYTPDKLNEVINAPIFGNHEICYLNKPLFFKSFSKSDIKVLSNIWDFNTNSSITITDLFRRLKFKQNWIAEWSIIKKSIPQKLVDILKNETSKRPL